METEDYKIEISEKRLADSAVDNWEAYWKSELKSRRGFRSGFIESAVNIIKRSGSSQLLYDVVKRELGRNKGLILEAGCGSAETALRLAQNGERIFLVDTSISALKSAGRYIKSNSLKAYTVQASIFQLPFRDNVFDSVFNSGVIDHFESTGRKAAVFEMLRVTSEAGKTMTAVSDARSIIHDRAMKYAVKRKRWRFGHKRSFPTLQDLFEGEEQDFQVREYSRGLISQFEFLYHFLPASRFLYRLFFRLFYILSCPFKFLNRFPGHLLITVIERRNKNHGS